MGPRHTVGTAKREREPKRAMLAVMLRMSLRCEFTEPRYGAKRRSTDRNKGCPRNSKNFEMMTFFVPPLVGVRNAMMRRASRECCSLNNTRILHSQSYLQNGRPQAF